MQDDDDAEIEGWLRNIGKALKKYGPAILKTGLKLAKNFGDEELKRILAAMQDDDDAEIEGWFSSITDAVKKYGPTILKTGLKLASSFGEEKLDRELAAAIVQMNDARNNNQEEQQESQSIYEMDKKLQKFI